jgi:hypothetical protein
MSVPCSPFLIVFVNLIPISLNLYSLRRSVLLLAVFISIATISFSQHVCFLNNYRINQKFGRGNDDLNLPLPGGDIKEFKTVIVLSNTERSIRYFSTKDLDTLAIGVPSSYNYIFADSGFYLIEYSEDPTQYKRIFPKVRLDTTGNHKSIHSIDCLEYRSVLNNDTSFFYITYNLPRSLGIMQIANVAGCILGYSDANYSIFPIYMGQIMRELIQAPVKPTKVVTSLDSNFVKGKVGTIAVGKTFPSFKVKDFRGHISSDSDFLSYKTSIVVFWDRLRIITDATTKKSVYENSYNLQIKEILLALDSACHLQNADVISFSTEFRERLADDDYAFIKEFNCVHFCTNAEQWQGLLNIKTDPLMVIVNRDGRVTEILTAVDIPDEELATYFVDKLQSRK